MDNLITDLRHIADLLHKGGCTAEDAAADVMRAAQALSAQEKLDDTYTFVVRFVRSRRQDLGCIRRKPEETERAYLLRQFVQDLQLAYDHPDVSMAGEFMVVAGPGIDPLT